MGSLRYSINVELDGCCDQRVMIVRGDLGKAVQELKRRSSKGLLVGGVKLPLALAELGLMMSTNSWCIPGLRAVGRRCSRGSRASSILKLASKLEFASGTVALRYEPRRE